MQKVIFIGLVGIFMVSCSVSKYRAANSIVDDEAGRTEIDLNEIVKGNLTKSAFFVQKAEIEISGNGQKQKFIASVKYNPPDTFLISVRTIAGIEAARIFITADTILVNDRVNRTLIYGTQAAGSRKYGFSSRMIPLLFGDVIIREDEEPAVIKCPEGLANIEFNAEGYNVNYSISCSKARTISVKITGNAESGPVLFTYYDFERLKDFIYPGRVSISHIGRLGQVDIRYDKVEIPWNGRIVFIPGNNYEHIQIQ